MNDTQREIEMFGLPLADLRESLREGVGFYGGSVAMLAMSILSDVQQELEFAKEGNTEYRIERARQQLNQAKFLLSEKVTEERRQAAVDAVPEDERSAASHASFLLKAYGFVNAKKMQEVSMEKNSMGTFSYAFSNQVLKYLLKFHREGLV